MGYRCIAAASREGLTGSSSCLIYQKAWEIPTPELSQKAEKEIRITGHSPKSAR